MWFGGFVLAPYNPGSMDVGLRIFLWLGFCCLDSSTSPTPQIYPAVLLTRDVRLSPPRTTASGSLPPPWSCTVPSRPVRAYLYRYHAVAQFRVVRSPASRYNTATHVHLRGGPPIATQPAAMPRGDRHRDDRGGRGGARGRGCGRRRNGTSHSLLSFYSLLIVWFFHKQFVSLAACESHSLNHSSLQKIQYKRNYRFGWRRRQTAATSARTTRLASCARARVPSTAATAKAMAWFVWTSVTERWRKARAYTATAVVPSRVRTATVLACNLVSWTVASSSTTTRYIQ